VLVPADPSTDPATEPAADPDAGVPAHPVRRTAALVGTGAGVVVCGLAASRLPGLLGDVVGGAGYAVLVALGVALVARRRVVVVGVTFALCATVELLQATGLPAIWVEAWPPLRYVVGTRFYAPDLLAYAAGAVLGSIVADAVGRRAEPSAVC
jgi:hypothetical protein